MRYLLILILILAITGGAMAKPKSKYKKISRNNIPKNLKKKILIKKLKIKNYNKKNVIKKITQNLRNTRFKSNNITVVDYLDFYSKYYFSPHTVSIII